jgi:hypothetical protein
MASTLAEQQGNVAGIVSSELGIAKIFGLESAKQEGTQSFKDAGSMQDIGRRLLISVGLREPSDEAVSLAIEANKAFVARLEQIAGDCSGSWRQKSLNLSGLARCSGPCAGYSCARGSAAERVCRVRRWQAWSRRRAEAWFAMRKAFRLSMTAKIIGFFFTV